MGCANSSFPIESFVFTVFRRESQLDREHCSSCCSCWGNQFALLSPGSNLQELFNDTSEASCFENLFSLLPLEKFYVKWHETVKRIHCKKSFLVECSQGSVEQSGHQKQEKKKQCSLSNWLSLRKPVKTFRLLKTTTGGSFH